MAGLTLEFLGPPQLRLNNISVTTSRRAVIALLAYLAVNSADHSDSRYTREALSALFWPDYNQSRALSNLRHTLWEVTKFIGTGWILVENQTISLDPKANIDLDVEQFRSLLSRASQQLNPSLRVPILLTATNLYRDHFLTGFSLKDASEFNDWILVEADKLHRDFSSVLGLLIEDYSRLNQVESAIPYAQRLVALDPLHETAHSQLIQLYAQTGQHALAVQHYKTMEKLMRRELNVDPQPETRALYKKIRQGEFSAASRDTEQAHQKNTPPHHNLPVHLTRFIGRERERDQLCRLLEQNRLVTVVGTGGIGKTRLSLQAGQYLLNDYRHGVWFIPFDSLSDEDLVPKTVATTLGIAEKPGETILEAIVNALRDQNILLIFDNSEHLLDACAQLSESLLKRCQHVKILASSRNVLGLEGEAAYHLPPMAIPQFGETNSLDELVQYESVRLFVERAGLVVSGFELTKENSEAIVGICNRLDGIPLAIELAAARLDIFSVSEILKQLNSSFDLLAGSKRSLLPRHQTMRACIAWDWRLLGAAEETFMRQLSVFAGGWTLKAAQAICDNTSIELMSGLVKKSLIEVHQEAGHQTRYAFHHMVRQYAYEQLMQAGEEHHLRGRHLEYFLELSGQLDPSLPREEKYTLMAKLFSERDNIRAALEWAARTNVVAGLYLSRKLRTFWENYELRDEARWILML